MIRAAAFGGLIVLFSAMTATFGWVAYGLMKVEAAAPGAIPAPPRQAESPAQTGGFEAPPFDSFEALLTRPVFSPDRRAPAPKQALKIPEPEPEPVEEEEPEPPVIEDDDLDIVLRGVVTSAAGVVVLLEPVEGGPIVRLSVGEAYEGWRLTALDDEGAIFERDDREIFIGLTFRPLD